MARTTEADSSKTRPPESDRHNARAMRDDVHETYRDEAYFTDTQRAQKVIPYLFYDDGIAAMDYLTKVFGLAERRRQTRDDGTLFHGELVWNDDLIFLGSPDRSGNSTPFAKQDHDGSVFVTLDDPDSHYEDAVKAGAKVDSEPSDLEWGRMWVGTDTEGRNWYFSQRLEGY